MYRYDGTHWVVLALLVALLVYTAVVITRNDLIFGGVGIWVLVGLLFERLTASNVIMEIVTQQYSELLYYKL